ncbi:cysteine desulfurase-like protein [Umezawaea sp. Da 62-37]|uniref:cysteine desulfurase-like protein n=1 Tax=Umezawaea sp. Da 62-37 TaxID=3075927 RepID=UPI0028F7244A|nr:cysteine desulfurase-like protein [Umezawaea sp. Da 62-37]WNV85882.1 cysteine desulfurase-like protein [Umezawaea sp. Da 62-37]
MTFDIAAIRSSFPALADGYAYLDGAAGTQTPISVIDAISSAYRLGIGNVGGPFPASARSMAIVADARQAVADLVGGQAAGVVLGPNSTTLVYRFAHALGEGWREGDEIVLSRLDHDANVRPWAQAAARAGAVVRWAEVDADTGELPVEQYDDLLTDRTRLVAVTAASNILGTRPDVAAITAKAHAVGALTFVDGVHSTPHDLPDVRELGADFFVTSAYKWAGPHIGALVADPALLESLPAEKLTPSPDRVPERFETGTSPFADLAGVTAAVEHVAGLALPLPSSSRRERLRISMEAVGAHERELFEVLIGGLGGLPDVTLYGKPARRTAIAYFRVAGHTPAEVAEHLAMNGVNVWHGHSYAWELTGVLGLRDTGGAVRAGLAHYNDRSDVDRFLDVVAGLPKSTG